MQPADLPTQCVTIQVRLARSATLDILDTLGSFYGDATRALHLELRDLAAEVKSCILSDEEERKRRNEIKCSLMERVGLTSRQYNAIIRNLEGRYESVREAAKAQSERLEHEIATLKRNIAQRQKAIRRDITARREIAERKRKGKAPTKTQTKALIADRQTARLAVHQKKRRLAILTLRQRRAFVTSENTVPPIVFGSKKLFEARAAIHPNDTRAIAAWRRKWDASRNGNFIMIGSACETSGNQTCQAFDITTGIRLWIKAPPGLVRQGCPDRVSVEIPYPARYKNELLQAIRRDEKRLPTPVAWRFVRDPHWSNGKRLSPWRVFVTFSIPVTGRKLHWQAQGPVLGTDVNADHLALCLMTPDGNPISRHRIDLPLYGKSSSQRKAIIGDATTRVVEIASASNARIAHEILDFKKKKRAISSENKAFGSGYARMLSSFAYKQILEELTRKSARAGVDYIGVNPAYTSVIGAVNLARRYGMSTHQAAAGAIARRAQGHSERINYIYGLRGRRHTRIAPEDARRHMWHHWRRIPVDKVRPAAAAPSSSSSAASERAHVVGAGSSQEGGVGSGIPPVDRGASLLPDVIRND